MIDDIGIFRTTIAVAHLAHPDERITLDNVIVDTGSEYNCWVRTAWTGWPSELTLREARSFRLALSQRR